MAQAATALDTLEASFLRTPAFACIARSANTRVEATYDAFLNNKLVGGCVDIRDFPTCTISRSYRYPIWAA